MAYTVRRYSTTEPIPPKLPSNYRLGNEKRNCQNCIFYKDKYCGYWNEIVKGNYLCKHWMTNSVDVPVGEIVNDVPTACNLYYGEGQTRISSNGSVAIIEILYSGNIKYLINRLPDGWEIKYNTQKILVFNLWGLSISTETEIFTYKGRFKPLMTTISDWDGNKLTATINAENIHYWEMLDSLWEDYDGTWESYGNTYVV